MAAAASSDVPACQLRAEPPCLLAIVHRRPWRPEAAPGPCSGQPPLTLEDLDRRAGQKGLAFAVPLDAQRAAGQHHVEWDGEGEAFLTGPAVEVFEGERRL